MTSEQPWSRSPLRRGTQAASDILAERFPNTPLFGARSRITRAQGSQLRRTIERTLGSVVGEEALNKLPEAGLSRLFWEAQLGTSDNGTLTKLRNALADEYKAAPETGDADFNQWLREAKQAGFGDVLEAPGCGHRVRPRQEVRAGAERAATGDCRVGAHYR